MIRYMFAVTLGLISVAIPLRAANRPHAGTDRQNKMVWTNDDLDKLHTLGRFPSLAETTTKSQLRDLRPHSTCEPRTPSGMRRRQRGCTMNLNTGRRSFVITSKHLTTREVSRDQPAASI